MLLTSKYPEHTVCASVSIFTVSSEKTISGFSYSNIHLDSKFIFSFNFFTCNFMLDYHSFYHRPEAAAFRQRAERVSRLRAADTFCLIARLVLHCPAGLDFALRAQSRASPDVHPQKGIRLRAADTFLFLHSRLIAIVNIIPLRFWLVQDLCVANKFGCRFVQLHLKTQVSPLWPEKTGFCLYGSRNKGPVWS